MRLDDEMVARFGDPVGGAYFLSAAGGEALVVRPKELYDGALPSGNAVAALNHYRLAHLTGAMARAERGAALLHAVGRELERSPSGHSQALLAADFALGPACEIVIAGAQGAADTRALLAAVRARFLPNAVVLHRPPGDAAAIGELAPFARDQRSVGGMATAYVCRNLACRAPVTDPGELARLLDGR